MTLLQTNQSNCFGDYSRARRFVDKLRYAQQRWPMGLASITFTLYISAVHHARQQLMKIIRHIVFSMHELCSITPLNPASLRKQTCGSFSISHVCRYSIAHAESHPHTLIWTCGLADSQNWYIGLNCLWQCHRMRCRYDPRTETRTYSKF